MFKWLTNWLESRRIRREIHVVATIRLQEGSVLVFEHPRCLSKVSVENMKRIITEITGAKAMILEDGAKLVGVVHPKEKQRHIDYITASEASLPEFPKPPCGV